MIKLINKISSILIIIILTTTPIISASFIIKENSQNNTKIENKNINQKIMNVIQTINETLLKNLLEKLVSFGPRMTGTYGCEKAAEYIYNKFKKMNLTTRYQPWESFGNKWNPRFFKGKNIEATLKGKSNPEKDTLIFNAHYDSVKVSPGANDDGSGVVAVLAAAYALSKYKFNRTIKFVTFSGEEEGLLGSKAYVKEIYENNTDILVELNADMIGYAETTEGGKTYRLWGTEDTPWIINSIKNINQEFNIGFLNMPTRTLRRDLKGGGSDYFNFLKYGYECIIFWQSEYNKEYYHTPNDTIEHVNFSYLVNTTRLIAGTLAYLADAEIEPPQIHIASPKKGKLYFEDRILKTLKDFKTTVIDDVLIYTEVEQGSSPIKKVEFYYDGKLQHTAWEKPYIWRLNKISIRKHNITAIVYDENGKTSKDTIYFTFLNLIRKR